jgi:ZIP family zinc transporter
MTQIVQESLQFALIPTATMIIGGLVAYVAKPSKTVASFTQHFAAGVVFAAVALELLPKLGQSTSVIPLTLGFILGVALMILVKELTGGHDHSHDKTPGTPWGLLVAIGIDLFIDGLLIGIAFVSGEKGGVLIAIALAIEILFLGLSLSSSLANRNIKVVYSLLTLLIMATLILVGSLLGSSIMSHANKPILEAVLSFGVAALLYLVTEELLEEAHEVRDTPLITSAFFTGFLIIFLLNHQF